MHASRSGRIALAFGVAVGAVGCTALPRGETPAGAPRHEQVTVAVASRNVATTTVDAARSTDEPDPSEREVAAEEAIVRDEARSGELQPVVAAEGTVEAAAESGLLNLRLPDAELVRASGSSESGLRQTDWSSIAKMNDGTPSLMRIGDSWGMSLSSGMDRLEDGEPTLDLVDHGPGFNDTFLFLSAHYRLTRSAHLIGSIAGVRAQDEPFSDIVGDGGVDAFTLGVYMNF